MLDAILVRDVDALMAAFIMDPHRKELYVEGRDDVSFLLWLSGNNKSQNILLQDISSIGVDGIIIKKGDGNKDRAICLARFLSSADLPVKFFLDADFDRVLGKICPTNVLLTDKRDLEGYYYSENVITKLIFHVFKLKGVRYDQLIKNVHSIAKYISCCRILSLATNLKLPFQNTDLSRHVVFEGGVWVVKKKELVRALLQQAKISLKNLNNILDSVEYVNEEITDADIEDMLHGKDTAWIILKLLRKKYKSYDENIQFFCASFERSEVEQYPSLKDTLQYISS